MDQGDDRATRNELSSLWRSVLPSANDVRRGRRQLHLKAMIIATLVIAAYWGLVMTNTGLLVRMTCAAVLATGLIAVATCIMHDANHGAFSQHRWLNRLVACTADGLGASSWLWRFKHNTLHHGATNVEGVDSDIAQAPFARLGPSQRWRSWHRLQHIYLWPLYGFMAMKNLLVGDLKNLVTQRIGPQALHKRSSVGVVLRVVAGKVAHFAWAVLIPLLFNPWWAVLVFYLCMSWVVGFVLAVIFQLAHCVEDVDFVEQTAPRRGEHFIPHQLRTTANVNSKAPVIGHLFRWLVGGLDCQIEHHLAPRLPHTAYASVSDRFRRGCVELGVPYRQHRSPWAAVRSHARWLKRMGQPTMTTEQMLLAAQPDPPSRVTHPAG
jgi:linoleoyl-CoA desaturase